MFVKSECQKFNCSGLAHCVIFPFCGVYLLADIETLILLLYRDEATRLWNQREQEWNRERQARERLMKDVSNRTVMIYSG